MALTGEYQGSASSCMPALGIPRLRTLKALMLRNADAGSVVKPIVVRFCVLRMCLLFTHCQRDDERQGYRTQACKDFAPSGLWKFTRDADQVLLLQLQKRLFGKFL